jgi:hypothetical protein
MTTLASAPPDPVTTSSLVTGPVCPLVQAGSAAMLMVFILGGVPSSFTDPVTSPTVAGSTDLPAGALAAGAAPGDSVLLPPHPTRARTKAPIARENIPNLLVFTEKFLLLNMYESQKLQGLKPLKKTRPICRA